MREDHKHLCMNHQTFVSFYPALDNWVGSDCAVVAGVVDIAADAAAVTDGGDEGYNGVICSLGPFLSHKDIRFCQIVS